MLKYLDIARIVGAGVKCPDCNSMQCLPSRWHSKEEKRSAFGLRPYRCADCDTRFLAPGGAAQERVWVNVMAGVMVVVGAAFAISALLDRDDTQAIAAPVAAPSAAKSKAADAPLGDKAVDGLRMSAGLSDTKSDAVEPVDELRQLKDGVADGKLEAMVSMGRLLAAGEKIAKDEVEAAKLMQLAASAGNPEGMLELGRFYRDGTGMQANAVRAYIWFSRAAVARQGDALRERDILVQGMSQEALKEAHDQMALNDEAGDPLPGARRR